jgi:hypothetical protein
MMKSALPPHPVGEKGREFIGGLQGREKELHALALEKLGSSYFVEKSLGFKKWEKKVIAATATATATAANPTIK